MAPKLHRRSALHSRLETFLSCICSFTAYRMPVSSIAWLAKTLLISSLNIELRCTFILPNTFNEPTRILAMEEFASTATTTSCDSASGIATPASTEPKVSRRPEVPSWFLKHRLRTAEELECCEIPLKIYDSTANQDDTSAMDAADSNCYEIDAILYESLFDLVVPVEGPQDSSHQRKFAYDALGLRVPHSKHGQRFLHLVVQHFAKDIEADMVTLGLHDFEYLANHFALESGHTLPPKISTYRELYFVNPEELPEEPASDIDKGEKSSSEGDMSDSAGDKANDSRSPESQQKTNKNPSFPFDTLFDSIRKKRDIPQATDEKQDERPVIVLIPDVHDDFYEPPRYALAHLRNYVKQARRLGKEIAVIAIDNKSDTVYLNSWSERDDKFLADLGSNPIPAVQVLVPRDTAAQKKLLEQDYQRDRRRELIRVLQERIRKRSDEPSFSGLLEPHAEWEVPEGSFAAKRLENGELMGREAQILVSALSADNLSVERMVAVFERVRVVTDWQRGKPQKKEGPWDKLHEGARKAIKEVEGNSSKYEFEKKLLDSIVSPGEPRTPRSSPSSLSTNINLRCRRPELGRHRARRRDREDHQAARRPSQLGPQVAAGAARQVADPGRAAVQAAGHGQDAAGAGAGAHARRGHDPRVGGGRREPVGRGHGEDDQSAVPAGGHGGAQHPVPRRGRRAAAAPRPARSWLRA
ncbi:hypothetical protein GGR52DRAFT_72170 [Hypoxylon sp. FL1284]|nr:hypothetical protein GGR52DRAFT_72170 [Hypoxylon sp. FL1284]